MSEPVIIDPMVKQLMESAATGQAARRFLEADLGKHIIDKASAEIEDALAELVEAPASDTVLIDRIQTRIKVARQAVMWLTDAIAEGENAMRQLEGGDES